MAIKSSSVRKKSRMSAWRLSMSSTRKAPIHPRSYSLSATAAAAVMAAVMVVGDATHMSVAEAAITDADAMAAEVAITAAEVAVASALGSAVLDCFGGAAVAAVVAAGAVVIGAGATA